MMQLAASQNAFKSVLVVDDDASILRLMDRFLSSRGFRVNTASRVEESLQMFRQDPPDLLLVDYSLPDGTGLDIVRSAVQEIPDLSVIVMTGVAVHDVEVAAEAIKAGAIEFLTKPMSLEVLESQIQRSLEVQKDKRRKRRDLKTREVFTRQLISLLEKERHHLARELHDEIGQTLTTLKMDVELLMQESGATDSLADRLNALLHRLTGAIEKVRSISYGLRPSTLDAVGLKSALELLVSDIRQEGRPQIRCFLQGLEGRLHRDLELAVYRIVQEALTNVIRHAAASNVFLNVIRGAEMLSITLEDDGVGFDVEHLLNGPDGVRGLGLLTMQERAEQFGGKVWIDSRVGRGTCLSVQIPLNYGKQEAPPEGMQ